MLTAIFRHFREQLAMATGRATAAVGGAATAALGAVDGFPGGAIGIAAGGIVGLALGCAGGAAVGCGAERMLRWLRRMGVHCEGSVVTSVAFCVSVEACRRADAKICRSAPHH